MDDDVNKKAERIMFNLLGSYEYTLKKGSSMEFFHKYAEEKLNEFMKFVNEREKTFNCLKCEDTGRLVRYGNKELGEATLVRSNCDCEIGRLSSTPDQ